MSTADKYRDLATGEVREAELDYQDQHTYFLDRAKVFALLAIEARLGELVEQGKPVQIFAEKAKS